MARLGRAFPAKPIINAMIRPPLINFSLSAGTGSYLISGASIKPLAARKLGAAAGSYVMAGVLAVLTATTQNSTVEFIYFCRHRHRR